MPRLKRRTLETTENSKGVTPEMRKLVKEYFFANDEANAAKRKADKARKSLLAHMKDGGVRSFDTRAQTEETTLTLTAVVKTGMVTAIDVEKLRKVVGDDQKFMGIVSATKTAVTEACGTAVADQCAITAPGKENVKVSVKK